jgi:hypothetical protein
VATDLGSSTYENPLESPLEPGDLNSSSDSDFDEEDHHFTVPIPVRPNRPRRLSTFEDPDTVMDLEGERIGGSARQ